MSKGKLVLVIGICVILLVSVTGASLFAESQGDEVEVDRVRQLTSSVKAKDTVDSNQEGFVQIEVAEGTITEETETIYADVIEQNEKSVAVYTNVIELPYGTVTERIEQIGSQSDDVGDLSGQSANDYLPMHVLVDENDPQKIDVRPRTDIAIPLSWSVFIDTLYATCSSGAKFEYSSSNGTSTYTLRWSGGEFSNNKTCSGAQCNYTITTSWNAYYTYADAQILAPAQVWGPSNAYRCN